MKNKNMNKNFNNIDIEEKRKIFLEELEKAYKKNEKFDKFWGPSFKNKLIRLFFYPNYYFSRFFVKTLGVLFYGMSNY